MRGTALSHTHRKEKEQRHNFVAMLQSSLLQFIIFVEEILIAINLDLNGRLSWPAVFVPLYVLSVVSLAACILSCALKKCNVEVGVEGGCGWWVWLWPAMITFFFVQLEILGFINLLQLIFLGVRLEGVVMWRWAVSCQLLNYDSGKPKWCCPVCTSFN